MTITNYAFNPGTVTVTVGTKVTWTNADGIYHVVASDSGVFNSGQLAPNGSFSFTFNTPGTYTYYCSIHSYMKGTIGVR